MIKRYLMLLFVLTGLPSCESAVRPPFEKMSETELATYNASLPTAEQVICQDAYADWVGGSYRRVPKLCLTVWEIKRQQRLAEECLLQDLEVVLTRGQSFARAFLS